MPVGEADCESAAPSAHQPTADAEGGFGLKARLSLKSRKIYREAANQRCLDETLQDVATYNEARASCLGTECTLYWKARHLTLQIHMRW